MLSSSFSSSAGKAWAGATGGGGGEKGKAREMRGPEGPQRYCDTARASARRAALEVNDTHPQP